MPTVRLPARRLVGVALGASLLAALPVAPAAGHGTSTNPEYFVRVTPATVAAGTTAISTVLVKQLVNTHHSYAVIGSLRITPPAGFVLTGATAVQGTRSLPVSIAGGVATAENLDLRTKGQRIRFTLTSEVRCGTVGVQAWKTNAHESTDYESTTGRTRVRRHPDSKLATAVLGCSLDFLRQPALAGTGVAITSVAADPGGASVAVRLLDGNGQPSTQSGIPVSIALKPGTGTSGASLGGDASDSTNSNGVAAFAPTIDKPGFGYRFTASAGAGITGATSAAFDLAGVAVACTGSCSGSQSKGTTSASIDATTNGGVLALTLGLEDVDCDNAVNHWYEASSEPILFDVTQGTGRTVVTMRIDAASVDRPYHRYRVCFSSPESTFKNRYGATIEPGEAGILARCPHHVHDWDPDRVGPAHSGELPVDHQPCMETRWKDHDGNVYVRFSVPPGDPRAKI